MRSTWTSHWKAGQTAPTFKTLLHDGSALTSAQLQGKKYILFFYNHDGSETCTKEACNIRDHYLQLKEHGYTVYGVSEDSQKKHQKFISKFELPYPLITDEQNQLAKLFDIYGEKEFMGRISDAVHRTTFVIDQQGIIESVIHPVDSANHFAQIMESLKMNETK
jgi:thioredoxin-dependent peroxiredoxin